VVWVPARVRDCLKQVMGMVSPCSWGKRSAIRQQAISVALSLGSWEWFLAGLVGIILETSLFHLVIRLEANLLIVFQERKGKEEARTCTPVPVCGFNPCTLGSLLLSSRLTRHQGLSYAAVLGVFSLLWLTLFLTFQDLFGCFLTFPVEDLCWSIICRPFCTCDKRAWPKPVLGSTAM